MLAKGVANRTRNIKRVVQRRSTSEDKSCDKSEDKPTGQQEDQDITWKDISSLSRPFYAIYRRQDSEVEDNIFMRIRGSSCGGLVSSLFLIIYRCVFLCVSSLSFEPHDLVQQAGKKIFNFYKNPAVLASPTRKNIHLKFAVRFDHVFPSIELEIQI